MKFFVCIDNAIQDFVLKIPKSSIPKLNGKVKSKRYPIPPLYQGIYLLVFFLQWVEFASKSLKRFHRFV